jgi:hypothetical protein
VYVATVFMFGHSLVCRRHAPGRCARCGWPDRTRHNVAKVPPAYPDADL